MANDTSTLSTEVYLNGGEPTGMWINPRELSFLFCFPLSTEEEMLHSTCIEYYVRSTSIALSMPMMLLFYHSSRTELSTRQAIEYEEHVLRIDTEYHPNTCVPR